MSRETRPVPGLFGGVSQQIPAMRHPTHCQEQVNFLATVTDGLYTRPGSTHLSFLALTGANGASVQGSAGNAVGHYIRRPNGALYVAVLVNGNLMVYDATTGASQTVTFPNGKGYLITAAAQAHARNFQALTLADYTFVVNTDKVPAMTGAVAAANPTNVAYVDVRTAVASQTYTITVDGLAGTYVAGATTSQDVIAVGLVAALTSALGAGYTVSILAGSHVIKVVKTVGAPVVTCTDTWDNKTMIVVSAGVTTYADLPVVFETGFVVTINGSADTNRDEYYVKWDGRRWVETGKPGLTTTLDAATLPHQLSQLPDNSWVFEPVPSWGQRLAGDDDTAPVPTFVGSPIRDLFFFRNRLGFLAADSAVLSRAGEYFDFFPRTAVQVLDNDPIDLAAPVDGITYFAWAIPFNQNLVIWTDTKQQLVLTGGDVLSPKTARLLPASTFNADPSTRPASLGNRAVFTEKAGAWAQLSSYRVSQDTVTNTAAALTDHAPRYVPASPRGMASSTTSKMVVAVPEGASKSLAVLKYELDADAEQYTQRAWCQFVAGTAATYRVLVAHWEGHKLYLLAHYTTPSDAVAGGRFASEVIDFQRDIVDPGLGYALCLDRKTTLGAGTFNEGTNRTSFVVPYIDPAVSLFRCASGREPYPLAAVTTTPGSWQTTIEVAGNQTASPVWAGVRYAPRYEFTEAFFRDANGVPVMACSLKLLHYLLRYVASSRAAATVTPYLRDTYTYPFAGRSLGLPGHGAEQVAVATGEFRVPVDAKAAGTRVAITSDSVLEVRVPYAEWVGDVTMKARRG